MYRCLLLFVFGFVFACVFRFRERQRSQLFWPYEMDTVDQGYQINYSFLLFVAEVRTYLELFRYHCDCDIDRSCYRYSFCRISMFSQVQLGICSALSQLVLRYNIVL